MVDRQVVICVAANAAVWLIILFALIVGLLWQWQ